MRNPENPAALEDLIIEAAAQRLGDPDHEASVPGMTLRDWFAGQALTGWLAGDEPEKRSYPQEAAYEAYQYADAMLAERAIDHLSATPSASIDQLGRPL